MQIGKRKIAFVSSYRAHGARWGVQRFGNGLTLRAGPIAVHIWQPTPAIVDLTYELRTAQAELEDARCKIAELTRVGKVYQTSMATLRNELAGHPATSLIDSAFAENDSGTMLDRAVRGRGRSARGGLILINAEKERQQALAA